MLLIVSMRIAGIKARQILDSRGNPTIEAITTLTDGSVGWSAIPSGASTGKHEAVELRDKDPKKYNGLGVLNAVNNANTKILKAVKGLDASDQKKLDQTMIDLDGTENKSKLGANAILAVSLSAARAQATSEKKELYEYLSKFNPGFKGEYIMPVPMMNVLNGGKHGNWSTDIQEYMLMPIGAKSITEAIRMCAETYHSLKKVLLSHKYGISLGDEGGFAPNFKSNEEPFQMLSEAVNNAGYKLGSDIAFAIDPAASEFFLADDKQGEHGDYRLKKEGKTVSSTQLGEFFKDLEKKYPIISMEDVFAEDDWEGYRQFTATEGKKIQIVGDDLYVTNPKRLKRGIAEKTTNSILIKLNQIGTLTETVDTIILARKNGFTCVVSHRSGETEDTFIADFTVAMCTGQIKTGAPARSERVSKYNRLLRIEDMLGNKSIYAGKSVLKR